MTLSKIALLVSVLCLFVPSAAFGQDAAAAASAAVTIPAAQADKDKALVEAAWNWDWPAVKALVEAGANVEARDKAGHAPLFWAAVTGQSDTVQFLLNKGAKLEFHGDEMKSIVGSEAINAATVKMILEAMALAQPAGADLPLFCAAGLGKQETVAALLAKGAALEDNSAFLTPLSWAALMGQTDTVRFLLDKGADKEGGANKTYQVRTPLYLAVLGGQIETVKLLCERGASVDVKARLSLLEIAAFRGSPAMLTFLLDKGAKNKDAALASAVGHMDNLRLLLDAGADVRYQSFSYGTALHAAAAQGELESITLLLERGADIEAKGNFNRTPLFIAIANGKIEAVKLLMRKGAKTEIRLFGGPYSAGQEAAGTDNPQMLQLFLKDGDTQALAEALSAAAAAGKMKQLVYVMGKGVTDEAKDAALASAALTGKQDAIKLLLDNGANINAIDKYGRTPLMNACEGEKPETVKLLLEKGANIEGKNDSGETALWKASMFQDEAKAKEIVLLLLDCGADINAVNDQGKHLLDREMIKPAVRVALEEHLKQSGQWLIYLLSKTDYDSAALIGQIADAQVDFPEMLAKAAPAQKKEWLKLVNRQSSQARLKAGELNDAARQKETASPGSGTAERARARLVNEYIRQLEEIKAALQSQ